MTGFKTPDGKTLEETFLTNEEFMSRCVGTKLFAMGCNIHGSLGLNIPVSCNRVIPNQVGTNLNWSNVCASTCFTLATKTDGTLWTWGYNGFGQLGDNTNISKSSPVQTVAGGTNWARISTSNRQTVAALKCDGSLWAWGLNFNYTIGDGTCITRSSPVQTLVGGTDWCRVKAAWNITVGIKTDGTIWRWGLPYTYGPDGYRCIEGGGETFPDVICPVQATDLGSGWKDIYAGNSPFLGVKHDKSLWGWGDNYYGSLGDNTTLSRNSPVQISPDGKAWRQVSLSEETPAAIKVDGTLWGWGRNRYDQLNVGDTNSRSSPVQTVIGGTNWKCVSTATSTSVGYCCIANNCFFICRFGYATAAINTSNKLFIWGKQIGTPGTICNVTRDEIFVWSNLCNRDIICVTDTVGTTSTPTRLRRAAQPGGVYNSWCLVSTQAGILGAYNEQANVTAVRSDGTLWAWGCNLYGQLGNLNRTNYFTCLTRVCSNCSNWCHIAGQFEVNSGITADGRLWMWGRGFCGMLGNNSVINHSSPVQTSSGGTNWRQSALSRRAVAAIKTDGTLWIWGRNCAGQLGINSTVATANRSNPVQTAAGGTTWTCVAGGGLAFAATRSDGSLWTWGINNTGQLGTTVNSPTCRVSPAMTSFGTAGCGWIAVSADNYRVSALRNNGTIWSWGWTSIPGDGTFCSTRCTGTPIQAFGNDWVELPERSQTVTFGKKANGTMWTWGYFPDHGVAGCSDVVTSPTQLTTGGTVWKTVSSTSHAGLNIGVVCNFNIIYSPYSLEREAFTYSNIKSASVGARHVMLTRFIGDDL